MGESHPQIFGFEEDHGLSCQHLAPSDTYPLAPIQLKECRAREWLWLSPAIVEMPRSTTFVLDAANLA
jgi:hypothetical protein